MPDVDLALLEATSWVRKGYEVREALAASHLALSRVTERCWMPRLGLPGLVPWLRQDSCPRLLSKLLTYSFAVQSPCCFEGFSLVVISGGYSLVAVFGPLTAVASLVALHGL